MPHRLRSLPRLFAAVLATATLMVTGVLLAPAALAATDDVTWTVRTASNDLGAQRTNFTYTITPGGSIDDALVIANRGAEALELGVYAADGFTTDGGEFDVLVAGEPSTGLGTWVHAARDHVRVEPGKSVTVPFTVAIPENATPGDYAGGLVTSLTQPDDGAGVNVDRRLGIRINLRVGGDLAPALTVEDVQMAWNGGLNPFAGGDAELTYTLHNTGNTVLSAHDAAQVAGPFGWFAVDAAEVKAAPALLPGERWTQHVTVAGIAPLIVLTGSATVTPTVTDAAGSTSDLTPVTAAAYGWAVPWTIRVVVLLVVAALLLGPRLMRRRRAAARAREDARVQEAVAKALGTAE